MADAELTRILTDCDADKNGLIDYEEFITFAFPVDKFASQEILQRIFNQFDLDSSGYLTTSNIADAFGRLGIQLEDAEIDAIISAHDVDDDHQISFDEFKFMILGHM